MDPYIEAQKRLDRGETKCTIDTSLSAGISKQCRDAMSVSITELKGQTRMMNDAKRLTEKLSTLNEAKSVLVAKKENR